MTIARLPAPKSPSISPLFWAPLQESEKATYKGAADLSEMLLQTKNCAKRSLFEKVCFKVFGGKLTRRISNLLAKIGLGQLCKAKRSYFVFPPGALLNIGGEKISVKALAQKYEPRFFGINKKDLERSSTRPRYLYYEVLPPNKTNNCLSLIYYVGRNEEIMPVPLLGWLYGKICGVLWGSKKDFEAIRLDFEPGIKEPKALWFETASYSEDPKSFFTLNDHNLHLLTRMERQKDKTWLRATLQKGCQTKVKADSPFGERGLEMAFVAWNGSLDLAQSAARKRYEKGKGLFKAPTAPTLRPLGMKQYEKEGFDLRCGWLSSRKEKSQFLIQT